MTLQSDFLSDVAAMHPHVPAEAFVYGINISLRHRYIYVETPKCACSTLKLSLQRLELADQNFHRPEFEDIHLRDFSPLLNPRQVPSFRALCEDRRFFKFCIVRHPATRLVSAYLDKIVRNRIQKAEILRQLGLPEAKLSTQVSFPEFVRAVCEQPVAAMEPHWRTQYFQTFQAGMKYDLIGRFESLPEALGRIAAHVGPEFWTYLVPETRHKTASDAERKKLLTPDLLAQIHDKFSIDYETFGYDTSPA